MNCAYRKWPIVAALACTGCVVWIREPVAYRDEVLELVASRKAQALACFERALEHEQAAIETQERSVQGPYADIGPSVTQSIVRLSGMATIEVVVAPESGVITVQEVQSQPPIDSRLRTCVVEALSGLKLDPPDQKEGRIRLTAQFRVGSARPLIR